MEADMGIDMGMEMATPTTEPVPEVTEPGAELASPSKTETEPEAAAVVTDEDAIAPADGGASDEEPAITSGDPIQLSAVPQDAPVDSIPHFPNNFFRADEGSTDRTIYGETGEYSDGEFPFPSLEPPKSLSDQFMDIYLRIDSQNNIISRLKGDIKAKIRRGLSTMCEQNEIHNLNVCIQKENTKLECLLREALSVQEQDPSRKWAAIPLATTYLEDCAPINLNIFAALQDRSNLEPHSYKSSEDSRPDSPLDSCDDGFKHLDPRQRKGYSIMPRSQDLLFRNFRPENRKGNSLLPKDRMHPKYISHKIGRMHSTDSVDDQDQPDSLIDCIREKIEKIQHELSGLERQKRSSGSKHCLRTSDQGAEFQKAVCDCQTQSHFDDSCSDDIRQKYCELLEEFTRKEREVTKLKATVDSLNAKQQPAQYDNTSAEARMLRTKVTELKADRNELKVLVGEQARQIDDYRTKYMVALQKVEEQKCLLQKMDLDNRRIEDQINLEIQRIKDQFQTKLNEYAKLPKILENEQIKLAESCREKADLEIKLRVVCREFRSLKSGSKGADDRAKNNSNDTEKFRYLESELKKLKPQYELLMECKNRLYEKYDQTKKELDLLRTESAKIIVRLKERAQHNQAALEKHIDRLEKDLAKCRATACLSIADSEDVIKDMQSQLNCLSLSFDSSQKQIKSLKDHISYLSNGKTNSIVICCEGDNSKR